MTFRSVHELFLLSVHDFVLTDICDMNTRMILRPDNAFTITSPLYPALYPGNTKCTSIIKISESGATYLSVTHFGTEFRWDKLRIGRGMNVSEDEVVSLTGSSISYSAFIISDDFVWFTFESDSGIFGIGFFIEVEWIARQSKSLFI